MRGKSKGSLRAAFFMEVKMIGDTGGMDWIMRRLTFHEGLRLMPYKDTRGYLTIGVGRCIDTNPFKKEELKAVGDWKSGITKNAAMMLLRNDIERCINELKGLSFFAKLDLERQYALLDMCFQLGIGGLLKFKKMLKAMEFEKWEEAARECLKSSYAEQTPKRARRIARLIKEGIWVRD